jgi:hypothetical protein
MVIIAKRAPVSTRAQLPQFNPADAPFTTEKSDGESVIRYADEGIAAEFKNGGCPVMTFPAMLKQVAEKDGDKPVMLVESPMPPLVDGQPAPPSAPLDQWKSWTFDQLYRDSRRVAKGCMSFGHVQHDAVAVFGFNSPEWHLAAIGAMTAAGKSAGRCVCMYVCM